jgi:hypothetical protein
MAADMKPTLNSARRYADQHQSISPLSLRAVPEVSKSLNPGPAGDGMAARLDQPRPIPVPNGDLALNVTAAVVSVSNISNDAPMVLTTTLDGVDRLPNARYQPGRHTSLDTCLRSSVLDQTGLTLGHAEQLQTIAEQSSVLAVGYLALVRSVDAGVAGATWRGWYDYLPWEDWRNGRPAFLATAIEPRLRAWASLAITNDAEHALSREHRVRLAFGMDGAPWNEERVIDRFELLREAGLFSSTELPGRPMRLDHARVLAGAIGRLRSRLKVRPVVFELMDDEFTLFELQKTVEAILGPHLHKQNFRRLIESAGLVEPTGDVRSKTGGRPAKLFRFRHEVLMERPAPGVRVHSPQN